MKPDTLDDVTHMQIIDVEPDKRWGDLGTPKEDAATPLVGTRPGVLPQKILMGTKNNEPDNWLLLEEMEEGETAKETDGVKE